MMFTRSDYENEWILKKLEFEGKKPTHVEVMAWRIGFNAGVVHTSSLKELSEVRR